MGVGGSKPTAAEMLRDNKNAIRTSLREIDREERQIEKRRKEVEAKIKKSAQQNRIVGYCFSFVIIGWSKDFC